MRKSAKIVTALSVAGLAVAAGSAFTGTGLTNNAGVSQFVGGTVAQTVTGATLDSLVYGFTDGTKTSVNSVTLTFADATGGKTPSLDLSGTGTDATFTCAAIDPTTFQSLCSAELGTSQSGVTSASVTVN